MIWMWSPIASHSQGHVGWLAGILSEERTNNAGIVLYKRVTCFEAIVFCKVNSLKVYMYFVLLLLSLSFASFHGFCHSKPACPLLLLFIQQLDVGTGCVQLSQQPLSINLLDLLLPFRNCITSIVFSLGWHPGHLAAIESLRDTEDLPQIHKHKQSGKYWRQ